FGLPMPGDGLEMIDHTVFAVVGLVAVVAEAETEVDVFTTVDELRVEPSDFVEQLPTNEQAGAGHGRVGARDVDGGVVGREARVDMPWQPVLANHDAGMLDGVIGEQELAA